MIVLHLWAEPGRWPLGISTLHDRPSLRFFVRLTQSVRHPYAGTSKTFCGHLDPGYLSFKENLSEVKHLSVRIIDYCVEAVSYYTLRGKVFHVITNRLLRDEWRCFIFHVKLSCNHNQIIG